MATTVSVDLTFEVDKNGILHVSATHKVNTEKMLRNKAFEILKIENCNRTFWDTNLLFFDTLFSAFSGCCRGSPRDGVQPKLV